MVALSPSTHELLLSHESPYQDEISAKCTPAELGEMGGGFVHVYLDTGCNLRDGARGGC